MLAEGRKESWVFGEARREDFCEKSSPIQRCPATGSEGSWRAGEGGERFSGEQKTTSEDRMEEPRHVILGVEKKGKEKRKEKAKKEREKEI